MLCSGREKKVVWEGAGGLLLCVLLATVKRGMASYMASTLLPGTAAKLGKCGKLQIAT